MEKFAHHFELLSDTFSHGAYQTQDFNRPELRSPSVKGMIRWWHEALGHPINDSRSIFGSISNRRENTTNLASPVSIRVSLENEEVSQRTEFMPHKGNRGGHKQAIRPGTRYQLQITPRRGGLNESLESQLKRAVKAWLLLGAIGQRSNRAAGSILWDQTPASQADFEKTASDILGDCKISFAILDQAFTNNIEARSVAGDFLAEGAFQGTAPFGSAGGFDRSTNRRIERKPSPLKLKCLKIDDEIRLMAVWDHRKESERNLENGINQLVQKEKTIGHLLQSALPKLTEKL